MANKKTLKKRKEYTIDDLPIHIPKKRVKTKILDTAKHIRDSQFIAEALIEALIIKKDKKAFLDILRAHVLAQNVSEMERRTKVKRSTIYSAISPNGNPTLETIFALIHKRAS